MEGVSMNIKTVIIITSHSAYLDVCQNFIFLFNKYWNNCPFKIVLSYYGENINVADNFQNVEVLYNGEKTTLPTCIYNVKKKYNADYYLCFLGDAFITKKIDTDTVNDILISLKENNISYCNLKPKHILYNLMSKYKIDEYQRYLTVNERYGVSFVSFIAASDFIEKKFRNGITDLEFEIEYLNKGIIVEKDPFFYSILKKNIFNIYPGIVKGKWEKTVLNKLKKENPEFEFCKRESLSYKSEIIIKISRITSNFVPNKMRKKIKKIISLLFDFKFNTK